MSSITDAKKALRREMKARKAGVSRGEMERQARDVFSQLTKHPFFERAKTLLVYWSLPDELPTEEFINTWYSSHGKRFLLPVVRGEELELYEYLGPSCLQPQPPFGILEPQGTARVSAGEVDLVIVPGVAFSGSTRQRLGRGRGYYDRLLPQMPNAIKVGVCLREQVVASVPCEPHDLAMDYLFYSSSDPSK